MAKNQRRRAQEALFSPAPSTTPPEEEKAAERTETAEKHISGYDDGIKDSWPVAPTPAPENYIAQKYDIAPNCTNVPRLLYAILCEVVRGRV